MSGIAIHEVTRFTQMDHMIFTAFFLLSFLYLDLRDMKRETERIT
jgi:hypothetical protein